MGDRQLAFLGAVVVPLIFFVLLPRLFTLLGLLAALVVLCARMLSISKWMVTASSPNARLEWRVRGALRSASAVREIARALERGDELPLVDGRPPSAAGTAPV